MSNVQRMEAISNVKKRKYKCPFCDNRYDRVRMITHIEKKHPEYISDDYTATRIVFNLVNKKEKGTCVMCGKESPWNEEKGRYDRFCSPECVKAYTKLADKRLKDVTGKTKQELLKDPEYQNKVMLSHRSISGEYTFQDGSKKKYVGTYEKNFLRFMDVFLNIKSEDIETPGPIIDYEYKGKKHKWITDAYYAPYNLVFDIKDGGDNPNNREMPEYRAKQDAKEDAIKKLNKYNYIRLTDNKFEQLIQLMMELKELYVDNNSIYDPIIRVNESAMIEDNIITEAVIFDKDDAYYNFDKFINGQCNILFITGFSGGGKTTLTKEYSKKYKAEIIEIDNFECYMNRVKKDDGSVYSEFLYKTDFGKEYMERYMGLTDTSVNLIFQRDFTNEMMKFLLEYCGKRKNQKFIIEGMQVFRWEDYQKIKDYALIIKGTSALTSAIRRIKRNKEEMSISHILELMRWYVKDDKMMNKLHKVYKESSLDNNIDTIVFDIGDVLLRCDSEYIFGNYKMLNNKQKEEALSLLDKEYDEYSLEEILLYIDEHFPDLSNHKDELIDLYSQIDPYDYTYDLLNTLKDRGYKLYYLSNWTKWGIELLKMQNKLGFLDIFDDGLFSYEINMRKPDKNIYEYFIDKFDIIPDKTIFFDDKRKNIEAAKEIGMNAYEFNYEEYDYILNSHKSLRESVYSSLDANFRPKGKKNLSSFKRVHITEYIIEKYKKEYPLLRHVRCKDTKIYTCDGYMWFDNNKLVAVVGSCEYNDDNTKWIVSLEIMDEYKGYGLSKQILDYAVKIMNCKYLSVNKNNKIAKMIYDKYGFKVYEESDTMFYMTIDNNKYIKESINNSSILTEKGSYILLKEYVEPNSLTVYDEYTYSTIDSAIRLEQLYNQDIHCYSYDRNTDTVNYLGEMNAIQENDSYTVNWIDEITPRGGYIAEQLIDEDYNSFVNEEAVYDDKHKNPIYVILMSGTSPLSYAIKKFTKSEYTHCCISFNSKLTPFYSFGMKENLSLKDMGFSILNPRVKEYQNSKVKFAVYTMFVSDNQRKKMIQRLKWFREKEAFLGYDFIGLIKYVLNRSSDGNLEKWFCSRFVMEILGQGIKIGRDASLYSPQQVKDELTNISLVNKGDNFYEYDHRITDKNVNDIKNGRYNYNKE